MNEIAEKFEHLFQVIQSEDFLERRSLGGEIPFWISSFQPEQQELIRTATKGLINRLETNGIPVLEINLYSLSWDLLLEMVDGPEEIQEMELDMDKDEFKDALQSMLNIHEVLMPAIRERIEQSEAKVYFLTGIGEVYPFIRSHNILNNLQNVATEAPTVTFFPGQYISGPNGGKLELFGRLLDDNYYRAFNIDHHRIA